MRFLRSSLSPLSWGVFIDVNFSFVMTAKFVVVYRYYATDDGHCHWTDSSESFASLDDAQRFVDSLNNRIANGDPDIRPGHIVDANDTPPLPTRW